MGFSLNKQEFRDAVALRYNLPINGLPEFCVCGDKFNTEHAMTCKKGGFVSMRHNELRDITCELLKEVCKDVEKEPLLIPLTGEKLKYQTANTKDNARLDISARSFWSRGQRAFFDIRVFDPIAPSHIDQNLVDMYRRQENEKKRQYEERVINVEHASFTPLIFSISGGMGKLAQRSYRNLADMISEARAQPFNIVMSWMRCRISFSLLRSALIALRGTRVNRYVHKSVSDTDFESVIVEGHIDCKM